MNYFAGMNYCRAKDNKISKAYLLEGMPSFESRRSLTAFDVFLF